MSERSDQSGTTLNRLNGGGDDAAGGDIASMEDILASIRSMIAEEDAPAGTETPDSPAESVPADAVEDEVARARNAVQDSSSGSIADAYTRPAEDEPMATLDDPETVATLEDEISRMLAPMESSGGEASAEVLELSSPLPVPAPAVEAEAMEPDTSALDGMLADLVEPTVENADAPEPAASGAVAPTSEPIPMAEPDDMDLVKSLMAELTQEPEDASPEELSDPAPEPEASMADAPLDLAPSWLDEELSIPDMDDAKVVTAESDDLASLMDEIVDRTIADEESLAASATEAVPMAEDVTSDSPGPGVAPIAAIAGGASVLSLSEIARRAEADAKALSDGEPLEEASIEEAPEPEAEAETPEQLDLAPEPEPEPEPLPAPSPPPIRSADAPHPDATHPDTTSETDPMARTAPLEEIISRDVEMEAGGAFAELNRMVEEKATFEERGPRIGDLVTEALKPMLKEWLDENLQGIVERAVQKEVQRIASNK